MNASSFIWMTGNFKTGYHFSLKDGIIVFSNTKINIFSIIVKMR